MDSTSISSNNANPQIESVTRRFALVSHFMKALASASPCKPATETPAHWVEVYAPPNRQAKYFRYLYMEGRKLRHKHIPGGNVRSPRAQENLAAVEIAIAAGKSPSDIVQLIKSWRKHS